MDMKAQCDLCGGASFKPVYRQELPIRNAGGGVSSLKLRDVMCRACGLVFRNPQPTDKDFANYYEQNDDRSDPDAPAFSLASEHRLDQSDSYANMRKDQYRYFAERLGNSRGRFVEIGSFEGLLLSFFLKDGWKVFGIEPSVKSSRIARERYGIEVKNEFLRPGIFAEQFDAAMMVHVLEHVKSPLQALKDLKTMLVEDGLLFIEVPNLLTFAENNLSSFFSYEHLYYFTPRSLSNVLMAAGFDILEISGTFGAPIIRAIAKPGNKTTTCKDASVFADEFSVIKAKIDRQTNFIQGLRTKVENVVRAAAKNKDRVVIYGAGMHTERLFRLTPLDRMKIVGIVDQDPAKAGLALNGHTIYPTSDISRLNPDRIIISSYAFQEEIFKNLRQYEPRVAIEKLYDYVFELENMTINN